MRKKGVSFAFHSDKVFSVSEIKEVLTMAVNDANLMGKSNGTYYYNVPCSFDIETTSFYRDINGVSYTYTDYKKLQEKNAKLKLEKCSIMYVWQFGINGYVVMGRTWNEFITMCETINITLGLNEKRLLLCYVHNLSFEFQFLCRLFKWEKVFSIEERKPIYARCGLFIEFRCSYLLSGYPLAKLGSQLQKYKVAKMVGDLDYSLMRHSATPLTDKEKGYCINDVMVVMAYLQEQIENNKGIIHLPLTKTGYVRKFCRKKCLYYKDENDGKRKTNWRYKDMIGDLFISGLDEFKNLHAAFQGGFTHGNAYYNGVILDNVASYDFTSSYPYVMVSEKYPMTHGVKVQPKSKEEFITYLDRYLSIINIAFTGLIASEVNDNPISASLARHAQNMTVNNGRVVCSDYLEMTITNIDYEIIKKFYKWKKMDVGVMWCYGKDYLPTSFVKAILELYAKKTTLKGVQGKEFEYLQSKEMLNSCYGMTVTNILRDENIYDNKGWGVRRLSTSEMENELMKYNDSRNRFLSYAWGVFVTAYARRNLFTGIFEAQNDYVYSDTDSIKLLNYEKHKRYFDEYNGNVIQKLRRACKYHSIPFEMCAPKTIKGVTKILGVWDFEGVYSHFKTLGAKRYMVEKDGEFNLTVSGVNKVKAVPYMVQKWGNKCMEYFNDSLYLPPIACGKNIHTYIDYPIRGVMTDYTGLQHPYEEQRGVHLEPTDYHLSLSVLYLDYLRGLKLNS